MNRRVILHLMNGFKVSSISQIVKHLVSMLGNQEYSWHIAGLSGIGDMIEEYEQIGAKTVVFQNQNNGMGSLTHQIREYLIKNRVNVIQTHTMRTLLTTWVVLQEIPFRKRLLVKHITTKHTLTAPMDRKSGLIYSMIDRLSLYLPDILVPVSQTMGQKILAMPGLRRHIVPIHNAISVNEWYKPGRRLEFRKRFGINSNAFVVGFGGRLEPVKRLDILLNAFVQLKRVCPLAHLVLAGEGSLRPMLEQTVHQMKISQSVTWVGFCQDMPGFLSALDVYVLASINEGLPLSILEAMAAGKPVIATRVGGVAEVVTHEIDGILVPPRSADLLFEAILDLLENPDKRQRFAENARRTVQRKYGIERMVEAYKQLYERLA